MRAEAVALLLDVDEKTLEAWRHEDTGPRFIRVGRQIRYRPEDLAAWFDQRASTPGGEPDRRPADDRRNVERWDRRWALFCASHWLQCDPVAGEERLTESADYLVKWLRGELEEQP
jgi:hypothetical protein